MLECVVNISEGRDQSLVARLSQACGHPLDVHTDADHNRSVFTLIGTEAPRGLSVTAIELLDIHAHRGEHPRLGVIDVVPFVALEGSTHRDALAARNEYAEWIVDELSVPVFFYGAERTLPDIRKHAWKSLAPDLGPHAPHATAGAVCVGVRPPLIAYNVFLDSTDMSVAKRIANEVRRPGLRTLAFFVAGRAQISMNIVDTEKISVFDAFDAVRTASLGHGISTQRCELIGLVTDRHLRMNDESRWAELDLSTDKTVEFRSQMT